MLHVPFDVAVKMPHTHPPLQKIELKLGVKVIVIDWFAGTWTVSGQNSDNETKSTEKPGPEAVSVSPNTMPLVERVKATVVAGWHVSPVVYQDP